MKIKRKNIKPMPVLFRTGSDKPYEYKMGTIVALEYKRRDKPSIIFEDGRKIGYWWIREIIRDTAAARHTVGSALEIHLQVAKLTNSLYELMKSAKRIPLETLHLLIEEEEK